MDGCLVLLQVISSEVHFGVKKGENYQNYSTEQLILFETARYLNMFISSIHLCIFTVFISILNHKKSLRGKDEILSP